MEYPNNKCSICNEDMNIYGGYKCNGYTHAGKEDYKNICQYFGNPDGMIGSCVDCSIDNKKLWELCMKYKYYKVIPKNESLIL